MALPVDKYFDSKLFKNDLFNATFTESFSSLLDKPIYHYLKSEDETKITKTNFGPNEAYKSKIITTYAHYKPYPATSFLFKDFKFLSQLTTKLLKDAKDHNVASHNWTTLQNQLIAYEKISKNELSSPVNISELKKQLVSLESRLKNQTRPVNIAKNELIGILVEGINPWVEILRESQQTDNKLRILHAKLKISELITSKKALLNVHADPKIERVLKDILICLFTAGIANAFNKLVVGKWSFYNQDTASVRKLDDVHVTLKLKH